MIITQFFLKVYIVQNDLKTKSLNIYKIKNYDKY